MKNKNIVVFDLETTGLDRTKDQIIQISMIKVDPENFNIIDIIFNYIKMILQI